MSKSADSHFSTQSSKAGLSAARRFGLVLARASIAFAFPAGGFAGTYTVTNNADSGVNSLRWAIEQANANPGSSINIQDNRGTITLAL
jgi:hypothetical protein